MTIGKTILPHGLALAPMAGVTDRAMRIVCSEQGAEYAVTEMISAKALVYEQRGRPSAPAKTADLAAIGEDEEIPVAVQLFGSEPEFIAEAARLVSCGEYRGFRGKLPAAVDINMGCPVRKVVSNGEGSALMRDPEKIYRIVSAAVAASALPVTVKMRTGWDADSVNAPECAAAAEAGGAAAVTLHARTREQFYRPGIDLDVIGRVVSNVKIPVIGNGDVGCAADAIDMINKTGCAGVAVGRGAIGNPWIFKEIACAIDESGFRPPLPSERLETALRQLSLAVSEKGDRRGTAESKFALAAYLSGLHGAAAARQKLMNAPDAEAVSEVLTRFFSGIEE